MNAAEIRAQCIVECAKTTHIDISTARLTLAEYELIQSSGEDSYIPRDARMRRNMEVNPRYHDLLEYFNPRLPPDAYSAECLYVLVSNQCLTGIDSHYTRLLKAIKRPSFYCGKHPTMINTETPFMSEVVRETDSEDIICFGTLYESVTAFTYDELSMTFKHQRKFKLLGTDLTEQMVNALANICERVDTPASRGTLREIGIVRMRNSQRLAVLAELATEYEEASDSIKTNFSNVLVAMFRMAMFMRGWNGEEEYPISRAPVRGRIDTEVAVTQAIAEFENAVQSLGDLSDLFLNGPLVLYDDAIQLSSIHTIGSRLDVVKEGNDSEIVDSCIRISSNWFAATSWYYCQMFRIEAPFQIDDIIYTS